MTSLLRARRKLSRAIAHTLKSYELSDQVAEVAGGFLPPKALYLCAVGKAAAQMAMGVKSIRDVEKALLIVPHGTDTSMVPKRWKVMRASHPVPNLASVAAGRALLEFVAQGDAPIAFLISGGASALACVPHTGTSLAEKQRTTRALLSSGASIREINVVRKHVSLIKGGGLLSAARSPLFTLCVSDVIHGRIEDVGSGPSVPSRATVADARRIALAYGLPRLPFRPTPPARGRVRATIVASPEHFAHHVAETLAPFGRVTVRGSILEPIEKAASRVVRIAHRLRPGEIAVYAAEPSVALPRRVGRGGRSCHLAALVARDLPEQVIVAAVATDGQDGSSGYAGAVVDRSLAKHPAFEPAIRSFNTASLHREAGTAIETGPTGINFADLHIVMRM